MKQTISTSAITVTCVKEIISTSAITVTQRDKDEFEQRIDLYISQGYLVVRREHGFSINGKLMQFALLERT